MKIPIISVNTYFNSPFQAHRNFSNLGLIRSLPYDTVSFGAMKKNEINGIDLLVVNKFKAPIEKFHSIEDFHNWCNERIAEIEHKNFPGRQEDTEYKRENILSEWEYLLKHERKFTPAHKLLILDEITRDLSENTDILPPSPNKGVLESTIHEIENAAIKNRKCQISFLKLYNEKMQSSYTKELGKNKTGWIVIPSKESDYKHFENNVRKLNALSCKTWCTKDAGDCAKLENDDFHIYLENGKPKIGMVFKDGKISEIQGELNDYKIPVDYVDTVKRYIKKNRHRITTDIYQKIKESERLTTRIEQIKKDLEYATPIEIFNYFEFETSENEDGTFNISHYEQPDFDISFSDLGINENKLIENVKEIHYDGDFRNSRIKGFKNLKFIGGDALFHNSSIVDLGSLEYIAGDAHFEGSNIVSTGNLKTVDIDLHIWNSKLKNLGNIECIGCDVYTDSNSKISEEEIRKVCSGEIIEM